MQIILELAKNDIRKKIVGSYFGWFWLISKPIITIIVMWFVFSYGFKTPPVDGVDFFLWLSCGFVWWIFFSNTITDYTHSIVEYGYLLKQSKFNSIYILYFKFISNLTSLLLGSFILYVIYINNASVIYVSSLSFIYYIISLSVFTFNLGVLLASLRVFFKDVSEVLNSILQVLFWVTPIIWNVSLIPINYHWVLFLNPLTYIVEGVRDTFIYNVMFYENLHYAAFFWIGNIFLYLISNYIYKRLSVKFNDVL